MCSTEKKCSLVQIFFSISIERKVQKILYYQYILLAFLTIILCFLESGTTLLHVRATKVSIVVPLLLLEKVFNWCYVYQFNRKCLIVNIFNNKFLGNWNLLLLYLGNGVSFPFFKFLACECFVRCFVNIFPFISFRKTRDLFLL